MEDDLVELIDDVDLFVLDALDELVLHDDTAMARATLTTALGFAPAAVVFARLVKTLQRVLEDAGQPADVARLEAAAVETAGRCLADAGGEVAMLLAHVHRDGPMRWPEDGAAGDLRVAVACLCAVSAATGLLARATGRSVPEAHAALWG